jgi:hypothetical protein
MAGRLGGRIMDQSVRYQEGTLDNDGGTMLARLDSDVAERLRLAGA